MKTTTLDSKKIDTLRDLPDMIPVFRDQFFKKNTGLTHNEFRKSYHA